MDAEKHSFIDHEQNWSREGDDLKERKVRNIGKEENWKNSVSNTRMGTLKIVNDKINIKENSESVRKKEVPQPTRDAEIASNYPSHE